MDRRFALLVLIFVNVLWGSAYAVTKVALLELPPTLLAAFRIIISTLLLWLIQAWLARQKQAALKKAGFEAVPTADKLRIASLGVLGVGVAYILDYFGLNLTTATDASLMIIGEVTFTSLLAYWWANDSIGKWKMIGIALGAVGVTILVLGHVTEDQAATQAGRLRVIGDLLILAALLCQAAYTVLGTNLARRYQPFTLLTYAYTGSLTIWLPILAWHWATGSIPVTLSGAAWFGVFYLAIISSVFCYFIWFAVSSRIGAGASAISLFAQPVVGALVGLTWLHEPLTASLVVSALLIFIALYLTTVAPDGAKH